MLKNYSNNDKQISMKLKKILKNKYIPVESNDDTSNQTSNEADFLALRIIDNLIRFNQSFRLSQVAIKANMGKYNKKVGGALKSQKKKKQSTEKEKEAKEAEDDEWIKNKLKQYEAEEKEGKSKAQMKIEAMHLKTLKEQEQEQKKFEAEEKEQEQKKFEAEEKEKTKEKEKEAKELEEQLNQFDSDNKFPSSFESMLSAYSLMENINRNYRDLRPIFNNLSVPVYNDLKNILTDSNDLISKSIKSLYGSKSIHTQKNIFNNINDFNDKLKDIVNTFESIYNDFQQRKQTFNTNIRTGSGGFGYLSKIRNI